MQIVAAIDLKQGQVVRGVAGQREKYAPLKSMVAESAAVEAVAARLVQGLGIDRFYVADLDAIGGSDPAWSLYEEMLAEGARLWIDAGIGDAERARQLVEFAERHDRVTGIIVGLESIGAVDRLRDVFDIIGPERCIFSLDMHAGRPLGATDEWRDNEPAEIVADVVAMEIRRVIVLDLMAVGMNDGCPTLSLCTQLRASNPDLALASGGGIRSVTDLHELRNAGCNAALVASALHDGRLSRDDLERWSG